MLMEKFIFTVNRILKVIWFQTLVRFGYM